MSHHYHWGVENFLFVGFVAMLFRYLWKLLMAQLAGADGMIGQIGMAGGGLAQ